MLEDVFDKMGELLAKPVTNKGYRIYSFVSTNHTIMYTRSSKVYTAHYIQLPLLFIKYHLCVTGQLEYVCCDTRDGVNVQ